MPRGVIDRIRQKVRLRQYDMSAHAVDEMADDLLGIGDVETAVLNGRVVRTDHDDPRGTRYTVVGTGADGLTQVAVVGRFASTGRFLIITVYEVIGGGG
ncbi:MAG: DUF4258 domain-containing protein [Armatimonadetes bacterium]|nr:DUF4258 domain-containing protein [Armatimonadota bacterium]